MITLDGSYFLTWNIWTVLSFPKKVVCPLHFPHKVMAVNIDGTFQS